MVQHSFFKGIFMNRFAFSIFLLLALIPTHTPAMAWWDIIKTSTQSIAAYTWNKTKSMAQTSCKYASGTTKIAIGSSLLGAAAAQALLLSQNWKTILVAQKGLVTTAATNYILTDSIDSRILAPTVGAAVFPAVAASLFIGCSTLGATLTAKGAHEVWNADSITSVQSELPALALHPNR